MLKCSIDLDSKSQHDVFQYVSIRTKTSCGGIGLAYCLMRRMAVLAGAWNSFLLSEMLSASQAAFVQTVDNVCWLRGVD